MRNRAPLLLLVVTLVVAGDIAWTVSRHHPSRQVRTQPAPTSSTLANPAPPIAKAPLNIYAAAGAGMLNPAVAGVPYRLYVPSSAGSDVQVVDPTDPSAMKVVDKYTTGLDPQHVVPSWDMKTLYATNTMANSLTPIDPTTGKPSGKNISVADPYNMYFTLDGSSAIVVAEALQRLDFRDPNTFELQQSVPVTCPGVDHIDFSVDGSYLIATCEFSGRLVKVDVRTKSVVGYLDLKGSSPQDIKLDPEGKVFYVADMKLGGVHHIDAETFTSLGFTPTGKDAHGLYPSRDAKRLYVTNRGQGTITVIDFATRNIVDTWTIPGGGSPDMGGVSPDGKVLFVSGRYHKAVYAISTDDGHLIGKVTVGDKPHGLAVWPQPGRFSLGHTGVTR